MSTSATDRRLWKVIKGHYPNWTFEDVMMHLDSTLFDPGTGVMKWTMDTGKTFIMPNNQPPYDKKTAERQGSL